jgi:hypothetical protein
MVAKTPNANTDFYASTLTRPAVSKPPLQKVDEKGGSILLGVPSAVDRFAVAG